MKKIIFPLLIALLSLMGTAPSPKSKAVDLEVINKSGAEVIMVLDGDVTGAHYYIRVPYDENFPETRHVIAVYSDHYQRTTWTCNMFKESGTLLMMGNVRLVFSVKCPAEEPVFYQLKKFGSGVKFLLPINDRLFPVNRGEPGMEKVIYFDITEGVKGIGHHFLCSDFRPHGDCLTPFRYRY